MMQSEREERLEGKMLFWGKVEGNENDYLICYALATPKLEEGDFPLKKVPREQLISYLAIIIGTCSVRSTLVRSCK